MQTLDEFARLRFEALRQLTDKRITLSAGALGLTVAFLNQPGGWLRAAWVCFTVAILCGLLGGAGDLAVLTAQPNDKNQRWPAALRLFGTGGAFLGFGVGALSVLVFALRR